MGAALALSRLADARVYMSASGDQSPNKGEKRFDLMIDEGKWARGTFKVAEVTRPLCSVSRLCDRENRILFEADGGSVESLATGHVRPPDKVYVMHINLSEDDTHESAQGFARTGN